MDFPGGRVPFTSEMKFITESTEKRVSCYRILHENGETITPTNFKQVLLFFFFFFFFFSVKKINFFIFFIFYNIVEQGCNDEDVQRHDYP